MKRLLLIATMLAAALALAGSAYAQVQKAKGTIELSDPSGDVKPITTSHGSYPGFDVTKLAIASDGKQIKISATLKDPPGDFASSVLYLYFDTDNDPGSGITLMFFKSKTGFEYKAELDACIKFDNGMTACTGGSRKSKPIKRFGSVDLYRLKGRSENDKEPVLSALGFPGRKASQKIPITGKVVQGVIDYQDLKVKSGQTIRILVREACGPLNPSSLFPEILLTLK